MSNRHTESGENFYGRRESDDRSTDTKGRLSDGPSCPNSRSQDYTRTTLEKVSDTLHSDQYSSNSRFREASNPDSNEARSEGYGYASYPNNSRGRESFNRENATTSFVNFANSRKGSFSNKQNTLDGRPRKERENAGGQYGDEYRYDTYRKRKLHEIVRESKNWKNLESRHYQNKNDRSFTSDISQEDDEKQSYYGRCNRNASLQHSFPQSKEQRRRHDDRGSQYEDKELHRSSHKRVVQCKLGENMTFEELFEEMEDWGPSWFKTYDATVELNKEQEMIAHIVIRMKEDGVESATGNILNQMKMKFGKKRFKKVFKVL
jgi:hypothetical protein